MLMRIMDYAVGLIYMTEGRVHSPWPFSGPLWFIDGYLVRNVPMLCCIIFQISEQKETCLELFGDSNSPS